jgi:hypothetical protein
VRLYIFHGGSAFDAAGLAPGVYLGLHHPCISTQIVGDFSSPLNEFPH